MTFIKNIYQVWLQGYDKMTEQKFIDNSNQWKNLNPDWNYNFIDGNDLENACSQFSTECREIYDSFDLLHLKVDFGRYVLLYLNGGIYVDMDMYIFRPLDSSKYIKNIIKDSEIFNDVIGIGKTNIEKIESLLYNHTSFYLNNGFMLSTPKNPILKRFIEKIILNSKKYNNPNTSSFNKINLITGPKVVNNFFQKYINNCNDLGKNCKYKINLIPYYVFEPCTINNNCKITEDTVAIHNFELSWVDDNYKFLIHFYYKIKPYLLTIIIIAIFLIIIWFRRK